MMLKVVSSSRLVTLKEVLDRPVNVEINSVRISLSLCSPSYVRV